MTSLLNDIRASFRHGNALTRIIFINLGLFILVNLLSSLAFLFKAEPPNILPWLAVPSSLSSLITKPWTLITYMFLHEGFFHLFFNLLWLYFGGRIFIEFMGEKRLVGTYVLGGLCGALLYITAYNLFPVFSDVRQNARALGASASVLAIIVAIATKLPNYSVNLLFFGPVRLKYIAIFSVVLDLISFQDGNAGGHIAHLGGAFFGFAYIRQLNRGRDWSAGFYNFSTALRGAFRKRPEMKVAGNGRKSGRQHERPDQASVDAILDKISRSGYDSLSREEKDTLFRESQKS